jgi:uncharacterized DUF497 family protein
MEFEFDWSEAKESRLVSERGLSFKMVVEASKNGKIISDFQNPAIGRSHQRIILIEVQSYIVTVPYVIDKKVKFLKTMYFDRKYNEMYGAKNG